MMSWHEVIADAVNVVTIFSFIGGCMAFVYRAWSARAEMLLNLLRRFREKEVRDTFCQLIDRKDRKFYEGDLVFCSEEDERRIDDLLMLLCYVLHLKRWLLVMPSEFAFVEYYLVRVVSDPEIKKYLKDLKEYCSSKRTVYPYKAFDYALRESNVGDTKVDDRNEGKIGNEEKFEKELKRRFGGMTRSARSVRSRVVNYLKRSGETISTIEVGRLSKMIKEEVDATVENADCSASIKSALRHLSRALQGRDENVKD